MIIPADFSVTGDAATDLVSGKCFPNRPVHVDAYSSDQSPNFSENWACTAADGTFSLDMQEVFPTFDLLSTDHLYLTCRNSKGDELARTSTVP